MTITKQRDGSTLVLFVEGKIDSATSQEFAREATSGLDGVGELVLDFSKLSYISSAGLRVLLTLHKVMSKQGTMKLININDAVNEIFEVTGFSGILLIE